jgi:hypothetical protein
MKYLFVFLTILVIWIAQLVIAGFLEVTAERYDLYLITVGFTVLLFLLGFWRRT